jgi:DNA-binding transcriptional LysR family regulator
VDAVDALIVPENDDRVVEQVVLAVRDNKAVIAPDNGAVAEVLGFGRHGVLFSAGNPYDLARSINHLTASWKRQPFDFRGGDSIINRTTPQEVARTFARAYRRLGDLSSAMSKAVAS